MRFAELDENAPAALRDASGSTKCGDPLQHAISPLNAFQGNDASTDGNSPLPDIQHAKRQRRLSRFCDVSTILVTRLDLAERAGGCKKSRRNLMGADDASALRFDQANHHLQYGVVTARQKRADDRRHFGDHLQVRADFPPFGTACHATGKNHAVDAMCA